MTSSLLGSQRRAARLRLFVQVAEIDVAIRSTDGRDLTVWGYRHHIQDFVVTVLGHQVTWRLVRVEIPQERLTVPGNADRTLTVRQKGNSLDAARVTFEQRQLGIGEDLVRCFFRDIRRLL